MIFAVLVLSFKSDFPYLILLMPSHCRCLIINDNTFYASGDKHDVVIKWKHFPRYWPFVRGIHRSPVNSTHKGQWRGALMHSLVLAWINGWVNNHEAGDLRRHRAHCDVTVMFRKTRVNVWWSVGAYTYITEPPKHHGRLLPTWIIFNPSMDK